MARAVIVEVSLKEGENSESLIRRFIRLCKKEEIVQLYRERMEYKTKGQRKREKREKSYARKKTLETKRTKKEEKERKNILKRI